MTAIAARYGFRTSDNDFDGAIWASTMAPSRWGGGCLATPLACAPGGIPGWLARWSSRVAPSP